MTIDAPATTHGAALLLRLAAGCPTPADLDALTAAAGDVVAGQAASLDHALGLAGAAGRRRAATLAAHARRDALLRRLAGLVAHGAVVAQQARAVRQAVTRYAATAWQRERAADACPHDPDTARAVLWDLHRLGSPPTSLSRLQEILTENPVDGPYSSD